MIRLTLINGSERSRGNSDLLCNYAESLLAEHDVSVDRITLRDHNIHVCGACGDCNVRATPCAELDDMAALVVRMQRSSGYIYIAPVHGYGLSALMQTFIERMGVGYLRFERPLANKVGGAIVVGRRYGLVSSYNQIINNLLLNRMILVGSGYPVTVRGGAPGKALMDAEGLSSVRSMIWRMVGMARLLASTPEVHRVLGLQTCNERQLGATVVESPSLSVLA